LKNKVRPSMCTATAMPPAAISIGCTCWRTIRSTSASSARAAVAAGIAAAASVAAITRIFPSRRLRARARDDVARIDDATPILSHRRRPWR
jgi:hypothetical protein